MLRTAAKVDKNQAEIVRKLRQIGAYVKVVSQLKGFVDIVVAYRRTWFFMEIKVDTKAQLTPKEKEFWQEVGDRAPIYRVNSWEEALEVITRR
ncbi:hypothetical protein AHMF7605_11920 [Adhaeribacter arboris]|uniref:VRR-NUC domain-containing protein n=1 Tax=Adhaeribacter arboris TaxID=2072846 RepID=A0A2T2YFE0_9BACT|nr:hypothetical protein [Adhaeribacter arboris]PSR54178.1 hypothetical protein AHMF7605_11920 [Adhaeribacter arboris]